VYNSIPDENARPRMICAYDHSVTEEEFALGFRFDIVMRGRNATPFENHQ
jgi:protocatechuate 3,4-dioxygenase, beta subunit